MLTRRRFLGHLAGLGGALLTMSAHATYPEAPSLIRSRPNPHGGHLSLAVAEVLCTLHARHQTVNDRCLELENYRSASVEALELLAQKDWIIGNFGFANLSRKMAQALAKIEIWCPYLHHVENTTAEAIAILTAAWDEVHFENVLALDASGFQKLAALMNGKYADDAFIEFCGNFPVDDALAVTLQRLPIEVFLPST